MKIGKCIGMLSLSLIVAFFIFNVPSAKASDDPIQLKIDNRTIDTEVSPIVINGTTLVPVNSIIPRSNLLWDNQSQTLGIINNNETITLQAGDKAAVSSQNTYQLNEPAQIIHWFTEPVQNSQWTFMAPIRFLAEIIDADVKWNSSDRTINIQTEARDVFNDFSDIQGHWANYHIEYLVDEGVIDGYADGTFRPNEPVTRAEATKMIISELGYERTEQPSAFSDVKEGSWAEEYINIAHNKGIISGYPNGNFNPNGYITRGESASIIVRAYDLTPTDANATLPFLDVDEEYWAYDAILTLYQNDGIGYQEGDFEPKDPITRGEFAAFLERIANPF